MSNFQSHEDFVSIFLAEGEFISIPLERREGEYLLISRQEIIDKMDQLYKRRCRELLDGAKPTFAGLYYEAKAICVANALRPLVPVQSKPRVSPKGKGAKTPRPSWVNPLYSI